MNLNKIKKITSKNIKGQKFGNYIAKEIIGQDKSRHNIWKCECPNCKKTIQGTVYDLTHNRINLKCNCNYNNKQKHVYTSEEKINLLSLPVYYYIAHCINSDGKGRGETAESINRLYNSEEKLKKFFINDFSIGFAYLTDNVFNLIASKPHSKTSMEYIKKCIGDLANECYSKDIKYLGMPRIGSGKNGLKWEEVKPEIISVFEKMFVDKDIEIVFCYN